MFDFSLINAPGSLMDPLLKEAELVTRALVLTNDQLARAQSLLMQSFHDGLKKDTHPVSPVKMFPTFVKEVPDGKDKYVEGKFLALDLGGTNFRVLLIEIDDEKLHHDSEIFSVPQEMMHGTGEELFDYIALCIHNFMEKRNIIQYRFPLGFTFSFPCKQEGLTSARLTTWTKGFKCTGVEGEDVVQLLKDAIERRDDIDVEVLAVVNDTTGTMVSCAHSNVDCRVGLIVGTGTNACYMETIENVEMCQSGEDEHNQVIVNTELGAFGENNALDYLRTHWDEEIDKNSINVGKQLFEKMVSGMYMGEIVRNVLIELIQRKILLNGQSSPELDTPKAFQTAFISAIESDAKGDYLYTTQVLHELNLRHSTKTDFDIVRLVCTRVSTRAANLVSAAVSTILNKMQRPYTTVAVDGSVYKYHPHFHDLMEKKVLELTDPNYKFDIKLSEDGSGRGAALVAAVATQQEIKRKISIGQRNHIQPVNRKNSRMELKQFITQFNETY